MEYVKVKAIEDTKPERVSKITKEFIKNIRKKLKSKGYEYKMSKESAQGEWKFTDPDTGKVIALVGWHGTGSWGTGKIIFDLLLRHPKEPVESIMEFEVSPDFKGLDVKEYQRFLDKMERKIDKIA